MNDEQKADTLAWFVMVFFFWIAIPAWLVTRIVNRKRYLEKGYVENEMGRLF